MLVNNFFITYLFCLNYQIGGKAPERSRIQHFQDRCSIVITKVGDFKATSTAFSIMFPLYFGITPVDGIDLDTGPSFNWVVGGGIKQFDGSKKISEISYGDMEGFKHFSPTWRVSVRLVNYIHVGVNIGLKKNSGTSMTFGLTF